VSCFHLDKGKKESGQTLGKFCYSDFSCWARLERGVKVKPLTVDELICGRHDLLVCDELPGVAGCPPHDRQRMTILHLAYDIIKDLTTANMLKQYLVLILVAEPAITPPNNLAITLDGDTSFIRLGDTFSS